MKYWKARQLSSKKFKRFTGISPRTYRIMVRLVKDKEAGKKKPGCPSKLRIEDRVLMVIQYWREYRSYYHIGIDWGVSES
jgi:Helix-turn-helix of DDE superfamily endonuclease